MQSHTLGVILATALYLLWAWGGGNATGRPGIFFLDPEELGGVEEAVAAACIAFVSLSPGRKSHHACLHATEAPLPLSPPLSTILFRDSERNVLTNLWAPFPRPAHDHLTVFAYVYGLIAMREQMTAAPHSD